jgi:hypothetical protein
MKTIIISNLFFMASLLMPSKGISQLIEKTLNFSLFKDSSTFINGQFEMFFTIDRSEIDSLSGIYFSLGTSDENNDLGSIFFDFNKYVSDGDLQKFTSFMMDSTTIYIDLGSFPTGEYHIMVRILDSNMILYKNTTFIEL